MLKRNSDIDKVVALAKGDGSPSTYDTPRKEEQEEMERVRNERDAAIKTLKDHENEIRALTEELEKYRKYPLTLPIIRRIFDST